MSSNLADGTEKPSTDRFPTFHESDEQLNEANALLAKALEMLELDNYSGAMEFISQAGELAPWLPKVSELRLRAESTLLTMMESKLGDLEAIPFVCLREEDILWLNLDVKANFVLGKINGRVNLAELLSLPEMPRLEMARTLNQLLDDKVLQLKAGNPFPSKPQ